MTNPAAKFATPRITAGALFVDDDRVLLVRKTYGDQWDIPGGYVDIGESPASACRRELSEKILYVFDCGEIGDETQISLQDPEVDHWEWTHISDVVNYAIPRLSRRLMRAYEARYAGIPLYLEHGEKVPG